MFPMSPVEAVFVLLETASHPLHTAALAVFTPPADQHGNHARRMVETLRTHTEAAELFRRRPRRVSGYPCWTCVDEVDLEYHVQHLAVPAPGTTVELLTVVAGLHETPLDPRHPLWEVCVLEGLADGGVGVYVKVHLSLLDDRALLQLLHRSLCAQPNLHRCPAPWDPRVAPAPRSWPLRPEAVLRAGLRTTAEVATLAPQLLETLLRDRRHRGDPVLPLRTPPTVFNASDGRARVLAAGSWPLETLRAVAAAAGTDLDAVVVAVCAGAVRSYLLDRRALPAETLTAMVPTALELDPVIGPGGRSRGLGARVIPLATDEPDPRIRLTRIAAALARSEQLCGTFSRTQFRIFTALTLSPLVLAPLRRFASAIPPPFNVTISYLPGPARPRYWNSARLSAVYPAPTVPAGQGLSITLAGNDDRLDVGIVADRHALPEPQPLLGGLDAALTELVRAVGGDQC